MKKEPVRILQIIRHMNVGGAETFLMNVYRNIDREKLQFDFLVNGEGFFDNEIREMGGKIYYMDYITQIGQVKYKKELSLFFQSHKEYKIVHSHIDQVTGIILETAKECGVEHRISHSHSTKNSNNIVGKIYKKYLQSKICKNATLMCACGEEAAKWLYKKQYKKAQIINNGIEIETFRYSMDNRKKIRQELDASEDTILIGHVGRFSTQKNHTYLIKIFKEYSSKNENSLLILVGNGEIRAEIENFVKEEGLEGRVRFLGIRQDVNELYSAFDYFIFPSFYEGLSLVMIEAQISGIPMLASDTIDKNSDISGNIKWLSIKENPKVWSDELLKMDKTRKDNIECSQYDVKTIAKQLQKMYIEMGEEK